LEVIFLSKAMASRLLYHYFLENGTAFTAAVNVVQEFISTIGLGLQSVNKSFMR
jgi:hypothetical protein